MAAINLKAQNARLKKEVAERQVSDPGAYIDIHRNYRGDVFLTVFPGFSGLGDYPQSAQVKLGAEELKALQDKVYELRVQADVDAQVKKVRAAAF